MYLPYLYQRPVLSSGRKLTKESSLDIDLATASDGEKGCGFDTKPQFPSPHFASLIIE